MYIITVTQIKKKDPQKKSVASLILKNLQSRRGKDSPPISIFACVNTACHRK